MSTETYVNLTKYENKGKDMFTVAGGLINTSGKMVRKAVSDSNAHACPTLLDDLKFWLQKCRTVSTRLDPLKICNLGNRA